MKVRYKGRYEGTCQGVTFKPGEVKEVPDATATELLKASGQFEAVKEVKQPNDEIPRD